MNVSTSSERVAVALSGGVDSAVAAHLLVESGRDVVGFFLRNGVTAKGAGSARSCCSVSDANDARLVADRLGIPFYALDVSKPFARIIDRFVSSYVEGRTPNPCVQCNVDVKFGHLLELARSIGAARVATGHYARVREEDGRFVLSRAVYRAKDQSYVLSTLRQEQLARAEFPLGERTKDEVRRLARAAGLLSVADKPESQEICFVPTGDYRDLVRERSGESEESGEIVTTEGEVVGNHRGVTQFTVGQRRGLGIARGRPQHVVRLEPETRRVVIGSREQACASTFEMETSNWISRESPPEAAAIRVEARIRHRHAGAAAVARSIGSGRIRVVFDRPEFAITPGQTAVLYRGDDVLAAGTIADVRGFAD